MSAESHPANNKRYGPFLILGVSLFLAFGLIVLTSAGMAEPGKSTYHFAQRQLIWICLGACVCWVLSSFSATTIARLWGKGVAAVVYLGTIGMLLLVWVPPFGQEINGASRWVRLGGLQFQPSEFAKLALVYSVAGWVHWNPDGVRGWFCKGGSIWALLGAGVLIGLVGLQPDYGAAIVLSLITFTILFVAGARLPWLGILVVCGVIAVSVLVANDDIRARRFLAFSNFWDREYEYLNTQQHVALKSMALGGATGVGLGESVGKLGWLPEHETDFVFALIGEEFGFAGSVGVLLGYAVVVGIGFWIAERGRTPFARVFGAGLTSVIAFQVVVNVAVTTACSLNTGLPLPFISRGGSNILTLLIVVGLLLSIERDTFSYNAGVRDASANDD